MALTPGHVFLPHFSGSLYHSSGEYRHVQKKKKECTLPPLSPSWRPTQTHLVRLSRPNHTQPPAFDSVCIRGALGPLLLLLQSSSVLLLLLLVASLGSAPALPFAERRQQAATRLVSTSSGCDVTMPLCLVAAQKSETCSEYCQLSVACGALTCKMITAERSRRGRRDSRDEEERFNYHSYWLPTLHPIC